jgi:hypothetical protein
MTAQECSTCGREETMSREEFEDVMNDRLSFYKADGRKIRQNIKAVVDTAKNRITTFEVDLPVTEGDFFERTLPNKTVERFEVLDPGYRAGLEEIPPSFQASVRRVTDRPRPATPLGSITIHGDHARVNLNSVDQSTNISSKTTVDVWANLRATIEREVPEPEKSHLLRAVGGMKEAAGKPSFKDRYKEFMAQAANHMTILTPFLPMLTNLL